MTEILYPDNKLEMIQYYADGRKKARTVYDRESGISDNLWVSYNYDTAGRLQTKVYPGDSITVPNRIEYTYDSFGNLWRVSDKRSTGNVGGTNSISYAYDIQSRVTGITLWDGRTLNYTYTPSGQRSSIEAKGSGGSRLLYTRYEYDLLGRLSKVYENNNGSGETQVAGYAYGKDANNNPTKTVTYNQVSGGSRTYVSDSLGRIRTVTNVAGGVTISSFDYAINGSTDGLGRRTHAYETMLPAAGQGTVATAYDEYYTYDPLSRLTNWQLKNNSGQVLIAGHDYTFDNVGNRLLEDGNPSTYSSAGQTSGPAANSDILSEDPSYTYVYDANGNLTKRTLKNSTTYRLYYYDYDQKLTKDCLVHNPR